MPRQTKYIKEQVAKLQGRVRKAAKSAEVTANIANKKWRRVATVHPVDEEAELLGADCDDWETGRGFIGDGPEHAKEWAMLLDGKKEQEMDYVLNVIEKMRPAGAVKADMDEAWKVYASVQCK
jgi:hypothetical protein